MTQEHFQALLAAAETKTDKEGWAATADERWMTLHVSRDGVGMTVSRVIALKLSGELLFARSSRGEQFVLVLSDVYAASVEAPKEQTRQAGFR